jgi:hypothetical protein
VQLISSLADSAKQLMWQMFGAFIAGFLVALGVAGAVGGVSLGVAPSFSVGLVAPL